MKRITQLDGTRGLAILAVFFHHAFHLKLLWAGVDLFFILSGFLITGVLLSAKRHSLSGYFAHFYSRRARRILVPYLLSILALSLFFGFAWATHWYFYLGLTNFLLPLNIPHPEAFDPLWSLAVEEQFYVVWPFAVYFLSERHLALFATTLVLLAPLLRAIFHFQEHWAVYMLTPFRMDLLAVGSLLFLVYKNRASLLERWGLLCGGITFCVGVASLWVLSRFGVSTYGNTRIGNVLIFESALLVCLGIALWALSGRYVAPLQSTLLRYIGKISYTMYLVHLGVLLVVAHWLSPTMTAIVGLVVTVGYASLSWVVLERPLLKAGHAGKRLSGAVQS